MPPQYRLNYLNHETRIRTRMTTNNRGEVTVFTLQLEFRIEDEWLPAVRYDTAHGEAHIDYIDPTGVTYEKVWLSIRSPYNIAMTRAEHELKRDWSAHIDRFRSQMEAR
jgi:hypothetical protein